MTRIQREIRTIEAMFKLFCQKFHHQSDLCTNCSHLQKYAVKRLKFCQFGERKSTCARCPVHCYAPEPRAQIQELMRKVGPSLIWKHPWLSLAHVLDGIKDRLKP